MTDIGTQASLHAVVHGRVQGVGFREFVIGRVRSLRVSGYVRNLPDGAALEVVAEGPRRDLETLLAKIQKGPRLSTVGSVEVHWGPATGGFSSFEVRF